MLTSTDARQSQEALALLGLDSLAYVRPLNINGRRVYIIHAADGTPLTIVADRDVAFLTVRQNEMQPLSLH